MRNKQSISEWELNKPLDFEKEKLTETKKGKKNINATAFEADGHVFDSKSEYDFYQYLIFFKKELDIESIEMQPSFELVPAYEVECWKCNGTGLSWNEKTKRNNKCKRKSCQNGILHKKNIIYTADYKIKCHSGREMIVDVKGYLGQSKDFNLRKRLFEAKFGVEVVIVTKNKNGTGFSAWKWH